MKKIITTSISLFVVVSIAWLLQANVESDYEAKLSDIKIEDKSAPISESITELKEDAIHGVLDSFPIISSFDEALKVAMGKDLDKTNSSGEIDFFELEARTDNNSSLNYYINKYFNREMSFAEGEVISDVNGIDRTVSSVKIYHDGTKKKAAHKIYGEKNNLLGEFTIDAIGFESAESVNLCLGGKLVVDNISGHINGKSIFIYESNGELHELSLNNGYKGVAVKCLGNQVYVIVRYEFNTIVLKVDGKSFTPIVEVSDFEATSDVAASTKKGLILLNDIHAGRAVLVDPNLGKATKLNVTGACSIYEVQNEIIIVGESGRTSYVSLISENIEEVFVNSFEGLFLGFNSDGKEKKLLLFEKNKKILSVYNPIKAKRSKASYQFDQYKNFDELVFIWDGKLINLKEVFGIN